MLIFHLLHAVGKRVALGGNIGTGLCELIDIQKTIDCAVIEVSSFQLELSGTFTPHVAVLTNIYPNHLDRHDSFDAYTQAKLSMIYRQKKSDFVVMNAQTCAYVQQSIESQAVLFGDMQFSNNSDINKYCKAVTFDDIHFLYDGQPIGSRTLFDQSLIQENCAAAVGVLCALEISLPVTPLSFTGSEHRMQTVDIINSISFINDSKSTISQSTVQAVKSCVVLPVVLIGGLSKGVDRRRLIGQLSSFVTHVICFGAEREYLYKSCLEHNIPASCMVTLEDAFSKAVSIAQRPGIILFSPAGSSYDLYRDYRERGNHFIKLVEQYKVMQQTMSSTKDGDLTVIENHPMI